MERPTNTLASTLVQTGSGSATNTLEFARSPRDAIHSVNPPAISRVDDRVAVQTDTQGTEFTDTLRFQSPVMDVKTEWLEQQRVLLAGAGGAAGGPYKMLRTQILRRMDQLAINTLAVLSPTAGAGKTLTAINLAIAIAAANGRTVLLVDFDLRNPSIHHRFGFQPQLGVEECLTSERAVQEAMVKLRGYDRLTILPASGRVENSSELLSDQRAATLVAEMRARYANRVLIFDVPPVLQADDALAFMKHVQAGIVVVNEGSTKREDITRTMELLHGTKIIGTVLNGARDPIHTYY